MMNTNFSLNTRTVGVIVMPEVKEETLIETRRKLEDKGLQVSFISDKIYKIGDTMIDDTLDTVHSVLFDSIIVIRGDEELQAPIIEQLEIAFKHKKAIGFGGNPSFDKLSFSENDKGVTNIETDLDTFLEDVKNHRVWDR